MCIRDRTNTAWVPGQTQPVSGRAATEDQLKHVDDQVAENKANIADNTDKIGKNAEDVYKRQHCTYGKSIRLW